MEKDGKSLSKPKVYSALEVANICGVVNQTAINWIRSGHLKAFKTPGGQFRVYPEDLKVFMEARKMRVPESVLEACAAEKAERRSILIVDDDKAFNDVTAKYIRNNIEDIEVFQAFDGFEAGAELVQKKPKLVVLDLDLPGVDGFGVCSKIQSFDESFRPKVIVVTAMQDEESEERCNNLGVSIYIRKPVNLPELVNAINSL